MAMSLMVNMTTVMVRISNAVAVYPFKF